MFLACHKSEVTIKLKFYYSNFKNAVETVKIAVDRCYILRQFLTPLPSIDFREIRGLLGGQGQLPPPMTNFIAAIAVEGEQNAVDHCGNDGNFLPYSLHGNFMRGAIAPPQ